MLDSAADLLAEHGHELSETRLRVGPQYIEDFKLYWAVFAVLMSVSFKLTHVGNFRPRELDPFTKGLAAHARRNATRVIPAIRRLRRGVQLYDEHFTDVDVILSPVLAHPAPKVGEQAPDNRSTCCSRSSPTTWRSRRSTTSGVAPGSRCPTG